MKSTYCIEEYGFLIDENLFNCISDSYDDVAKEFPDDIDEIIKRMTKVKINKGGNPKVIKVSYCNVNKF